MPATTVQKYLHMNYIKSHLPIDTYESVETTNASTADSISMHKLHLVSSNDQQAEIYDLVGLSSPKYVDQSYSKINQIKKSTEHIKAIADVELFRAKKITATELKNRYRGTYTNWSGMKSRCQKFDEQTGFPSIELDPSFEKFHDFLEIMGPRPEQSWSIDRINPTGAYMRDNVRWASKTIQARNRTNTVSLTIDGTTLPLVEWAEKLNVPADRLRNRKNMGWTDKEVISGERSQSNSRYVTTALKNSRDPFDYTPWPINYREDMEHIYQGSKRGNEHRLIFWRRYAQEHMDEINIQGADASWPDYHTPTCQERLEVEELSRQYYFYKAIFDDANKKLSPDHPPRLYKCHPLPDWVEKHLANFR